MKKLHRPLRHCLGWTVLVCLWVLVGCLGAWGFVLYYQREVGAWRLADSIYHSFQLFTLESPDIVPPVPVQVGVARFLAPILAAYSLLKAVTVFFHRQLDALFLRFIRGHVVVCGLGRKGMQVVREFRKRGQPVVAIEIEEDNDNIGGALALGARVLIGDATDPAMLRQARLWRAEQMIAMSGDESANIESVMHASHVLSECGFEGRLPTYVHLPDVQLCTLLRQHKLFTETSRCLDIHTFNAFESAARTVFDKDLLPVCPLAADDQRALHVTIIGFGRMGESVLLQVARMAHFANETRTRITVVDSVAPRCESLFRDRYPQADKVCEIDFVEGEAETPKILDRVASLATQKNMATAVVYCTDDDYFNLSCALQLVPRLGDAKVPVLVRLNESDGIAQLLKEESSESAWARSVEGFGMVASVCEAEMILRQDLDTLARKIHDAYVRKTREDGFTEDDKPASREWSHLAEHFRESNRQSADHIRVKLCTFGYDTAEAADASDVVTGFPGTEVTAMARMEHARWCAERWLDGWQYGTPRDDEKRLHPDLVPWNKLSKGTQSYDTDSVEKIPCIVRSMNKVIVRT